MNAYEIKSHRGGLSPYEDKGLPGSFKYGKNGNIRRKIDSITGNQALIEATLASGSFNSLVKWFVAADDGYFYGFTSNGKIYQIDPNTFVFTLKYTDPDGDIRGAEQWYDAYGNVFLYWCTATKIHRKEIPGVTDWSDVDAALATGDGGTSGDPWPKTNLLDKPWHTLREANGTLNIANGQFLGLVGYDNSYTNESLDLIPGNLAKAIIERNNYAAIGSYRSDLQRKASLFSWDQISNNWNTKKELSAKSINAMIDTELLLMQVDSDGELFMSNEVDLVPLARFPGGGYVNPGAVTPYKGLALFGVSGVTASSDSDIIYSGIYSYGRYDKDHPIVMNLEYAFDCAEIGAVSVIGDITIFSYRTSGNVYGVKIVDTTTKADFMYDSLDLRAPSKIINEQPVWGHVLVETKPLPLGCKVELWYRLNKDGEFIQAQMEGNVTQFTTENGQEAIFLTGDKGKYFEYRLKGIHSGNLSPEILRVYPILSS